MRIWLVAALLAAHAMAHAQADVGLLNLVSGNVTFAPPAGPASVAKAFMKVREGDRFDLPAGSQLRVVYFASARQERWQGPASLRAAKAGSAPLSGAPAEVTQLPATDENLREARGTYEALRKALPGDDITPELFLYAALSDYQLYEDMGPVVAEMLRKQPGSEEVKTLEAWLKARARR